MKKLQSLKRANPDLIQQARGLGLMAGVELKINAGKLLPLFYERGVLVCTASDKVIRIVPPLVIMQRQLDTFIEIFADVLKQVRKKK